MIGRLQRVHLREVWRHEARDFTSWLQSNLDVLNDLLKLNLTEANREQAAGAFSVDLVATNEGGYLTIIENQLERSDHDHLGKLITYLAAIGARAAIWIVADPRPEHVDAINWLNKAATADFYLVKVEAVRIGESLPAPFLTLIVGPSKEGRLVGETKKELTERYDTQQSNALVEFWAELLKQAQQRTSLHARVSPSQSSWVAASSGRSGMTFNYVVQKHAARVELYIDINKDAAKNQEIFDVLITAKAQIENVFGEPLEWLQEEDKQRRSIQKRILLGGYRDGDRWAEVQDAMIDAMIRLEAALGPYIKQLPR